MPDLRQRGNIERGFAKVLLAAIALAARTIVEDTRDGKGPVNGLTRLDEAIQLAHNEGTQVTNDTTLAADTAVRLEEEKRNAKTRLANPEETQKRVKTLLKKSELSIPDLVKLDKIYLSTFSLEAGEPKAILRQKVIVFNNKKHKIISYRKHRAEGEWNFVMLEGFEDPKILKDTPQVINAWIPITETVLIEVLRKADSLLTIEVAEKKSLSPGEFEQYITTLKEGLKEKTAAAKMVQDELRANQPIIQTGKGAAVVHHYDEIKNKTAVHLKNYSPQIWVMADAKSIEFAIDNYAVLAAINAKLVKQKPFGVGSIAMCLAEKIKEGRLAELIPRFTEWTQDPVNPITKEDVSAINLARIHLILAVRPKNN